MKTLAFTLLLLSISLFLHAQCSCGGIANPIMIWAEDALGNRDSVLIGSRLDYSTDNIDPYLGEVDLSGTPPGQLELRSVRRSKTQAANWWVNGNFVINPYTQELEQRIDFRPDYYAESFVIEVHAVHFPVVVSAMIFIDYAHPFPYYDCGLFNRTTGFIQDDNGEVYHPGQDVPTNIATINQEQANSCYIVISNVIITK